MKHFSPIFYSIVALGICSFAAVADQPTGDIRLPASDFHYKATKDYIEEKPVPEYQHASADAYEAFKDMKYGVRIHWGLYSIAGNKPHESWPFLDLSFAQKQAYQELYQT